MAQEYLQWGVVLTVRPASGLSGMCWQRGTTKTATKTPIMEPGMVNRKRYRKLMIEVISAIKARMPRLPGHTIFVQDDGTKSHGEGGHWRRSRMWQETLVTSSVDRTTREKLGEALKHACSWHSPCA
ncbi:unnamed protein product [Discosporangium mesarthrocarpum]